MRQQVRSGTVIISIFAQRILESLTDAQDSVGFNHTDAELMVTQGVATPEVCNTIFKRFAQVPVVHTPHHNAACRKSRVKAAHVQNNATCLLGILLALTIGAYAILEHQIQAVDRHRLDEGIGAFIGVAKSHRDFAVLVPAALAVFDQQILACAQGHLHNFNTLAGSRRSNIDRHGFTSHGANFLHLGPTHIGSFPRSRHRRQESVARVVTRKVHHIVVTKAANSLDHIVGVRKSQFTRNLVHDNSVHTPVQSILRSGLARDHNRSECIDGGVL